MKQIGIFSDCLVFNVKRVARILRKTPWLALVILMWSVCGATGQSNSALSGAWFVDETGWTIELTVKGAAVSGSVLPGPPPASTLLPIYLAIPMTITSGDFDGTTIQFKVESPGDPRKVTFTGILMGDRLSLTRDMVIQSTPGAGPRGAGPNNTVLNAGSPRQVTARRRGIPVIGNVLVDEGRPRPVFELAFSGPGGKTPVRLTEGPQAVGGRRTFDSVAPTTQAFAGSNPSTFVFDLPAGEHRPSVEGLPAGYTVKSIRSENADLLAMPLKVADGTPLIRLTITLGVVEGPPWKRIRGRIENLNGANPRELERGNLSRPLAIMLAAPAFSEYFFAPIASDGSFEFPWVLPGTYSVRLTPNIPAAPASLVVGPNDVLNVAIKVLPEGPGR